MKKEPLLALTGVIFLVLLVASFVIAGEPPSADEDTAEIVSYYSDNQDEIYISALLFGLAALSLVFFGAYLSTALRNAGASILPSLVLVGASIIAVGGAIDGTILIALAEAADDIDPVAVQALQALWDNDFLPIALGILVFILSSGLAILRTGALPKWLGWVAIALAVVGVTPIGFVAFIGAALWIGVVSIMLSIRANRAQPA